jgi:hypothetical protein
MHHSQSTSQTLSVQIPSGLAIVFLTYIVTTALIILHLRSWDNKILEQILIFSSYPLIFFGIVSTVITIGLRKGQSKNTGVLPVATLIFMSLPFIVSQIGLWSAYTLSLLGALLIVFAAVLSYGGTNWLSLFKLICSGALIALFYFGMVNGYNYAHVFSDVASYTDSLHRDTLFHASIINMLAYFSPPSTGLDGVQPLSYHVAVHRWLAASLLPSSDSTPLVISIGLQIALLPALFFTWTLTLGLISRAKTHLLPLLVWAFAGLIIVGGFVWDSYLASESYAFSLPILLAMIPVAHNWIVDSEINRRSTRFFTLALTIVAIIACSAAKISTGVILGIFLITCFIAPKLLKADRRSLVLYGGLGLLLSTLCLGLAYFLVLGAPPLNVSLLHFVITYPKTAIGSTQIAVLCLWAFCAWGTRRCSNSLEHQALTLSLALTYAASWVPGLLLAIGGGSAGYFSHPALLILVLFGLMSLMNRWDTSEVMSYLSRLWTRPWSRVTVGAWAMAWLVITQLILWTSYPIPRFLGFASQSTRYLSLFDQNRPAATDIVTVSEGLSIRDRLQLLWSPPPVNLDRLQNISALYRIENALDSASVVPSSADTLIYISPNLDEFWNIEQAFPGSRTCWDQSFHIPAVLGFPLLNGVRGAVNDCDTTPYYGMADYDSDSWNIELSDEAACDKAKDLDFSKVFMVNEDNQRLLNCSNR